MKKEITGYITASINGYERVINRLHTSKASAIEIKKYENFTNELNDLLDYVTDIPEEDKEYITVILNSSELQNLKRENKVLEEHKMQVFKYQQQLICRIEELKNRINELEETCTANSEVIDTQFKKINDLKDINCIWQNTCIKLREENERLKEEIVKAKEHELPYIDFQKIYDGAGKREGGK